MIIRIDYEQRKLDFPAKAEKAWRAKNLNRTPTWYDKDEWRGGSRYCFMDLIKELSKTHPTIIKKSRSGNGTNSSIGKFYIKAASKRTLSIHHNNYQGTGFSIDYSCISSIEINDIEKLIVFNDELALKY
jgi:hypothetical protein